MGPGTSANLAEEFKKNHRDLKFCGKPRNALYTLPEQLLSYTRQVLRDETPAAPKVSIDQWNELISVLTPHRILPLLYRRIGTLPHNFCPPEPVVARLRQAFLESSTRVLRLEVQLKEILNALSREAINVLVMRGPALAYSVYPEAALRPCDDIDLLVKPAQMTRARTVLEKLGYQCLSKRFEACREFFREECFIHRKFSENKLMIDLHWVHWELHPLFSIGGNLDVQDIFKRAVTAETSSFNFKTFHPVDAFIHMAMHLTMIHSRDMRLIWINDIDWVARRLSIPDDWDALQAESVNWGGRMAVENCIQLAKAWSALQVPHGFNDFTTWPAPMAKEQETWLHLTRDHWVTVLLKRCLFDMAGLRAMLHLLFPPPDIVRYCYPPSRKWMLPLSYLKRWQRWFMALVIKRIPLLRLRE